MKAKIHKWLKSLLAKIEEENRKEECDFDEDEIDKVIDELKRVSFMEIYKYPNGVRILNVMGRGILVILNDDMGINHHLGDVWTFGFREHTKDVKVKGIEKMAHAKPIALCFGCPFCTEELEQMKTGEVNITITIDKI